MKKITLSFAALLIVALGVKGQYGFVDPEEWIVSTPSYMGSEQCRGMALGTFTEEEQKVLAVVTREGGAGYERLVYLNPLDGSELDGDYAPLSLSTLSGGNFICNDAEFTADGKLLICNLAAGGAFKVYRLDAPNGIPNEIISWGMGASERYGDTFTVTGSISNGTAKVYAVNSFGGGNGKVLCWSMIEEDPVLNPGFYVFDQTPADFYLPGSEMRLPANIDFISGDYFVLKGSLQLGQIVSIVGGTPSLLYEIPTEILPKITDTAFTSLKHVATDGENGKVFFAYLRPYDSGGTRVRIFLTESESESFTNPREDFASQPVTPSLGASANANNAGKIISEITDDNKVYLYILVTNNSLSKFEVFGINAPKIGIPVGVEAQANTTFGIRVANSILYVSGVESPSISLYNTTGQKIKSALNANQLPVEGLQGVYIVRVAQDGVAVKTAKVFIK